MNPTLGWTLAAAGMLLLALTWIRLQYRVSQLTADASTIVAAVAAAVGGLLILTDVGFASWIFAPVFAGFGSWLHRRVLFHGEGPLRT